MNADSHVAGQGTILVVDDDNSFRRALCVTLSGLGFTTVDVPRADEALLMVQVTQFDAVLLDVDMPGMAAPKVGELLKNAQAGHALDVHVSTLRRGPARAQLQVVLHPKTTPAREAVGNE